jgi:hypothetical protein
MSFRMVLRTLHCRPAPVAQLDRAPGFEGVNCRFDSGVFRNGIRSLRKGRFLSRSWSDQGVTPVGVFHERARSSAG